MKLKAKFDRPIFTANEAIISFVTADKWIRTMKKQWQ